jgi:hypothetical protein
MIIAGASALGGAWFISAMVATAVEQDNETEWLYIPVVGPFITLGARDYGADSCNDSTGFLDNCEQKLEAENTYAGVGLVLDGVIQAGGLAVLIAGLVVRRERAVPVYSIAPLPVRGGSGIQVIGSF